MSKEQEKLFSEIIQFKNNHIFQNIASYVQNDLSDAIQTGHLKIGDIQQMQTAQDIEFDGLIEKLRSLRKKCFNYFESIKPQELTSEQISNMLYAYYFSKFYSISKEPHPDTNFVETHQFYVIVTSKSAKNGYESDTKKVLTTLKLNTRYSLKSMNVSQSSSTIELDEFPNITFNSVNFEFLSEYDKKIEVHGHTVYE